MSAADTRVIDIATRTELPAGASRPIIQVNAGELPQIVREAEAALMNADAGIYQRGGQLVRIVRLVEKVEADGVRRPAGSVIMLPVTKEYLTLALARAADWVKFDARSRSARPIDPPEKIAKSLLAIAGEWRFSVLTGLVAAPTLRADGTLLDVPGYDRASGLFGAFERSAFPAINVAPSLEDAQAALALLRGLFDECEFAGGQRSAHASVALSATITAAVRHAVRTAPAFGISARKHGSGKTTAACAIAHICTGQEPPVLALSEDEAELRKCLLGILIAGDACVLIDNVAHPVDSAALCAMLTNATYSDRVLGVNAKVTVPTASTWLLTGNGLEFVGDLTSRVLLAVLDPETEHPEARDFKRDLAAYVAEHRGELLAAALTIPLAYLAAAEPAVKASRSRFAEWDRLVRKPLVWLGCSDPLSTQEEVRAADPVREGLVGVLNAWQETFGNAAASVAKAVETAQDTDQSTYDRKLRHPQLLEALLAVAGEKNGTINARRLGRYLVRNLRRIEDAKRLEEDEPDRVTCRRRFRIGSVTSVFSVDSTYAREKANQSDRSGGNAENAGNDEPCRRCAGEGCGWCRT